MLIRKTHTHTWIVLSASTVKCILTVLRRSRCRLRTTLVATRTLKFVRLSLFFFAADAYQIHNKRYLAVMLEADEVAAGGAAMALCGGQVRVLPGRGGEGRGVYSKSCLP